MPDWFTAPPNWQLGVVFDSLHSRDVAALVGPDPPQPLATAMHRAWLEFATHGDPGWERFTPATRWVKVFDGAHNPSSPTREGRNASFGGSPRRHPRQASGQQLGSWAGLERSSRLENTRMKLPTPPEAVGDGICQRVGVTAVMCIDCVLQVGRWAGMGCR